MTQNDRYGTAASDQRVYVNADRLYRNGWIGFRWGECLRIADKLESQGTNMDDVLAAAEAARLLCGSRDREVQKLAYGRVLGMYLYEST
jgi:hypothetical protein